MLNGTNNDVYTDKKNLEGPITPPPPLKKEKENPKTNKLKISGKTQHRKFFLHTLLSNYFSNISV